MFESNNTSTFFFFHSYINYPISYILLLSGMFDWGGGGGGELKFKFIKKKN